MALKKKFDMVESNRTGQLLTKKERYESHIQQKMQKGQEIIEKVKEDHEKKRIADVLRWDKKQEVIKKIFKDQSDDRLKKLERINEEDELFRDKMRKRDEVHAQVKFMNEQLSMKKAQIMEELKDLQKEFKLSHDGKVLGEFQTPKSYKKTLISERDLKIPEKEENRSVVQNVNFSSSQRNSP